MRRAADARTAAVASREDLFVLSTLPPTRAQTRLALGVVLALVITFLVGAGPLSDVYPGRIAAFVPAYATAMFVNQMFTSVLLFAQFSIFRTRALLALSSGYLFVALVLIPWTLAFPGVFAPEGLVGTLETRIYLFFLWHAGFPAFVIWYALVKDADGSRRYWRGTVGAAIALSVVSAASVALPATVFVVAGGSLLPHVQTELLRLTIGPTFLYLVISTTLLLVVTLVVLWIRRHSLLDLWLMVVVTAYGMELALSFFPSPVTYTFGWYAGRVCALLSSSLILLVLLHEIMTLYTQLLRAVRAQRREREARLMTGDAVAAAIIHEVRQPLASMVNDANACWRLLDRPAPDLREAKEALTQIAAAGRRAGAIISGIRTLFKSEGHSRTSLDLNDLITETFTLLQEDLQKQRIRVEADLDDHLPLVTGDRIQLQQVLVNLIANAIEAMRAVEETWVLNVKSERDGEGDAMVSISDTGTGIESQDLDRIFNPLFTTKSEGMGMGLSISRSIIEAHHGRIWAEARPGGGTIFRIELPVGRAPATAEQSRFVSAGSSRS
jgi:signal transduction histidine kinase